MFKKLLILGLIFCSFQVSAQTVTKGLIGKQDIHNWDGKTQTFTRTSSTGYPLTLNDLDWIGVDVCQVYGGGVNRTSTALSAAITAIGSTEKTELYLSKGVWTVTGNVSIPANYTLKFAQGAYLDGAFTLAFADSPDAQIKALPGQQIFGASLIVTFGAGGTKYANWWQENTTPGTTDMSTAIQSAINAGDGEVVLLAQIYRINTKITQNVSNKVLRGIGKDLTYLRWYGTGIALESDFTTQGSSLGYIQWKEFTITNYSSGGTEQGFWLERFTKGCVVENVKIVGFDIGVIVKSCWYGSLLHVDFESNVSQFEYYDQINDFEIFNCTFADAGATHIKPNSNLSSDSYGMIIRDSSFDGMGTGNMIELTNLIKGVITGNYFEVYETDDGGAPDSDVINLGATTTGIDVSNNIMIGPDTNVYTGKWINISSATSQGHTIEKNRQYQASGATFITTTSGSTNNIIRGNLSQASNGTIANNSVLKNNIVVRYPATIDAAEITIGLFNVPVAENIAVYFIPDSAVDLDQYKFRVYRADTDEIVLNATLGDYDPLDHTTIIKIGDIYAMSHGILLYGYLYKEGGSVSTPLATLIFEY